MPLYDMTCHAVMEWAKAELEHVGRITAVEDVDIQYSYAQSTVNGMLHLRDALLELVKSDEHVEHKGDLKRTHDSVVRVIKHLIKDYDVKLEEIKTFNTRHVLGDLSYLNGTGTTKKNGGRRRSTRKARRSSWW